ncbi:hypothetical protein [Lacimicrobium sp. SS2-24]|uniref:hypothetical protein n=1 Tax=Lacimicrobium sp. SS2-24 TaxID=2005569 RepID=UPI000B4BEE41|nr:hypothetical protein [Lacimicrobium sp. SS2-24]
MLTYILFFSHTISGSLALLAGLLAPFFDKKSALHRLLGTLFFYSILGLGLSGAVGAVIREVPLSMLNGLLICYLVTSSRVTIKQAPLSISKADWLLLGSVILLSLAFIAYALIASTAPSGEIGGFSWIAFLIFGGVALFCASADLMYIREGGLKGANRLIRHLWRMFFALFMSSAAFFLGQAQLIPEALRKIEFLLLPVAAVILLMLFWIIRVKVYQSTKLDSGST